MDLKKLFYKYLLKKTYYREGKCVRCGACCSKIYVSNKKDIIKSEEEFYKLQKLHPFYTYIEITGKDERGLIFKCNKFDKEKRICTIHKIRPGICRRYPSEEIFKMGAALSDECGFSFKPIESFSEVLNKESKKGKSFFKI
ncbi:MAG: YkgJ family cysteine cluster protein [Candidatus Gastranaerophilales bacterium]|nr:YkgJ family cysteine cluster protein [Candidatus Gastranaerophilales bacterium]